MRPTMSTGDLEKMALRRGDKEEMELLEAVMRASAMNAASADKSRTDSPRSSKGKAKQIDDDPLFVAETPAFDEVFH